jgi:hypothetical protein
MGLLSPTRRTFLSAAGALAAAAALRPRVAFAATAPEVVLDARVAWLGALARAAGFEEYAGTANPAWSARLDTLRPRLDSQPAVATLRKLRRSVGLGMNALPSLAVILDGDPGQSALLRTLSPWPDGLDDRWTTVDVPAFVEQLNRAAVATGFPAFWAGEAAALEPTRAALQAAVQPFDLAWMEAFFGFPAPGRVRVVPGLLEGSNNFSATRTGVNPSVTAVIGVRFRDGAPAFDAPLALLTHEVGHSFVNPTVAANRTWFQPPGERLFGAVRERMEALHYGRWETVVDESVLRAVVVRYLEAHGGHTAASQETAAQIDAGFPWVLVLADTLASYEAHRDRYPTFGEFSAELAAALTVIAGEEEDRAEARPHVVAVSPDPTHPVNPTATTFTVTFDRPMRDGAWSFVGDRAQMPDFGTPAYNDDRTVLTVPMRLRPGTTYRFALNNGPYRAFQSAGGVPLEPYPIQITTK